MAQLQATATRIKPPPRTSNVEELREYIKYLADIVAILGKNLDYIINGNLDANNIRANSIETKNLKAGAVTADKITVQQLSAIAADLGHITAGLVEAITMKSSTIIGSEIKTAEAPQVPRIELSSTSNILQAFASASNTISLIASYQGNPMIEINTPVETAQIQALGTGMVGFTVVTGSGQFSSNSNVFISAGNEMRLSFNRLYVNGRQGVTGSFQSADGKIVYVDDGFITDIR